MDDPNFGERGCVSAPVFCVPPIIVMPPWSPAEAVTDVPAENHFRALYYGDFDAGEPRGVSPGVTNGQTIPALCRYS